MSITWISHEDYAIVRPTAGQFTLISSEYLHVYIHNNYVDKAILSTIIVL